MVAFAPIRRTGLTVWLLLDAKVDIPEFNISKSNAVLTAFCTFRNSCSLSPDFKAIKQKF